MYKYTEIPHSNISKELNNNSVLFTVKKDRGIGKTAFMVKYAKENDLVLIVRNSAIAKMIKNSEYFEDAEVYSVTDMNTEVQSINPEKKDVLLIDDITEEQYKELKKRSGKKLVGFVSVEN